MYDKSIIADKLQDFKYYISKLPFYLQSSEEFVAHFRIWYDLLINENGGIVRSGDILLNLLNIFDDNYITELGELEDSNITDDHPYGTNSDILDKLGALFGVRRRFSINYYDADDELHQNVQLSLDNYDFLILIKSQIIKNYCDGSYKQLQEYYKSIGLNICIITASEQATSNVYLSSIEGSSSEYSEDLKKLFLSGLLTIKSMGITYINKLLDFDNVLIWDSATWNTGEWIL